MGKVKALTVEEEGGGDILILLDERVRRIAEEVVRRHATSGDVGAVKVKTAARLLDMSEYRVRQLIRERKLKAIYPTPNTLRISLSEIRSFQEGEQ